MKKNPRENSQGISSPIALVLALILIAAAAGAYMFANILLNRGGSTLSPKPSSTVANAAQTSPTKTPQSPSTNQDWQRFDLPGTNLVVNFPPDFYVHEAATFKPSSAVSAHIIAPESFKSYLGANAPYLVVTIYKKNQASFSDWFATHATKKKFDDPTVSMKDSPYFFREYSDPKPVVLTSGEGWRFSSRTMNGIFEHTVVVAKDQNYFIDFASNELMSSGPYAPLAARVLNELQTK